jgi:hypothetical protein
MQGFGSSGLRGSPCGRSTLLTRDTWQTGFGFRKRKAPARMRRGRSDYPLRHTGRAAWAQLSDPMGAEHKAAE